MIIAKINKFSEQRNNSLRKMDESLAHMKLSNYIRSLTLYFAYTNLKTTIVSQLSALHVFDIYCQTLHPTWPEVLINWFIKTSLGWAVPSPG